MIGEGFELDTHSEQSQGVSLDLNKAKMPALKDELQADSKELDKYIIIPGEMFCLQNNPEGYYTYQILAGVSPPHLYTYQNFKKIFYYHNRVV